MNRSYLTGRGFLGLTVVALGVMLLVDTTGVLGASADVLGTYWPVFIIGLGTWLALSGKRRVALFPLLITLVGVGLLLSRLGVNIEIFRWWPVIVIAVGALMLYRRSWGSPGEREAAPSDVVNVTGLFGEGKSRIESQAFKGGAATAFMGSIEIDLSQTAPADGSATLDVSVIMASAEIRVPSEWRVNNHALTLFGGADDKRPAQPRAVDAPSLTITGLIFMGGLEINP